MIFVSTGGIKNQSAAVTAADWSTNYNISNIELSGGKWDQDQLEKLKKLSKTCRFQIHNYFPPPKKAFVFNLAATDAIIVSQSISHALNAMQWSIELNRPIFSFHAGFLIDLKVCELGTQIARRKLIQHSEGLERFIENVNILADKAKIYGVKLLIENNVVSANNYRSFEANPCLMASYDDAKTIMENTPGNVKMLVDVAHLKVSAKTLNFSPHEFLGLTQKWTDAYHLSDNDGLSDSNKEVCINSWFWPFIKRDLDYYSLEVYTDDTNILAKQIKLTDQMLSMPARKA